MLVPSVPVKVPAAAPTAACVIKQAGDAYDYLVATGSKKQDTAVWRVIWLGILAGIYIGIGYALASVVSGQVGVEHGRWCFILSITVQPTSTPQLQYEFRTAWKGIFNLLYGAVGLPVGLTMVCWWSLDHYHTCINL